MSPGHSAWPARAVLFAVLPGLVLLAGPQARAEHAGDRAVRAGLALAVQQGDYGTDTTETVTSLTPTLRYWQARGDVQLSAPYLWVTTESPDGSRLTVEGPGDVRVDGRLLLTSRRATGPAVRLLAGIKLPTADEAEGLGTGETDVTAGVAVDGFVSTATFWFADLDYTVIGDPPDVPLDNQWRIMAGGGSYIGSAYVVSAALEQRTAVYPGTEDAREAIVGAAWLAPIGWQAALSVGLSDGAPDVGASLGVYAYF